MKKIVIARSILQTIGGQNTIFSRGNITVHRARTSEEILDMHGVHKADMIISEASLPRMGGIKLCSAIRSAAHLKDVSIVMVCSSSEADACRQAGANAVIGHPVDHLELFSRISELLTVPQRQDIRTLLHVSTAGRTGSDTFLGISHNVSISGLLLATDRALNKGERITCTITIGNREITAEGVIARTEKIGPGKYRYGVRFSNLDIKALVLIEQFSKGASSIRSDIHPGGIVWTNGTILKK